MIAQPTRFQLFAKPIHGWLHSFSALFAPLAFRGNDPHDYYRETDFVTIRSELVAANGIFTP
jgi:hypothetical protein